MTALQTTLSPVTVATFINSSSLSGNTSIADEKEIEKEVEEDPVLELLWAITVAIFVLFGMFGAFASSRVADHFGRYVIVSNCSEKFVFKSHVLGNNKAKRLNANVLLKLSHQTRKEKFIKTNKY